MTELVTYRGVYGHRSCTLRELPGSRYGTHYMCFDEDPGCGPMAFPVSHGFKITGVAVRCEGCGGFTHSAGDWRCMLPHWDRVRSDCL